VKENERRKLGHIAAVELQATNFFSPLSPINQT
jgi:hypothetical protein